MNRELSLANQIAWGKPHGAPLIFKCENCGSILFIIRVVKDKVGNRHEDIVIERIFSLKCTNCGTEEYIKTVSIIPSWSGKDIDRYTIPEWEEEND
jgi:YgiT-type zinc finger domain-containing protein